MSLMQKHTADSNQPYRIPILSAGLFRSLAAFYERNLFERIIIYIFFSSFIVKVYFEFMLGEWSFLQSQNKQWIFYGLLALDYLVSVRKVIAIRVTLNMMSMFAFVLFIMIAHGLFVGFLYNNFPFVILNDLVPPLMIAFNILRFQSQAEYKPIDFIYLLKVCTLLSIGTTVIGLAAQFLGKPSAPSVGNITIYLSLILAAFFYLRPFPKWIGLSAFVMIILLVTELNRTTLAFLILSIGFYLLGTVIKRPATGIVALFVALVCLTFVWVTIPEESGTYRRIVGLYDLDLSARTGSVGERQAEMEAVQAKLDSLGPGAQLLGLGFGGLYEVQFTHQYLTDYGHAHYSWVWFNLRFGMLGYLYLVLMVGVLIFNAYTNLIIKTPVSVFISLLCISSLIFCVTYVNSIFLMSGITFYNHRLSLRT